MVFNPSKSIHPVDFFIIFLVSILCGNLLVPLMMKLGWLTNQATFFFATTVLQDGFFLMGIYIFLTFVRKTSWKEIGCQKTNAYGIMLGVLSGVAIYITLLGIMLAMNALIPNGMPAQNIEHFIQADSSLFEKALVVFTVSVIAPISEELLFRGYLLTSLKKITNPKIAAIVTALIFGLIHGDLYRFIPLALGGLILCYLVERTQSLIPSIISHGMWNFIMILFYYLSL